MKFSGVITNDKSDSHAKGQGQRSKVKVTEVKTPFSRFRTVTIQFEFTYGSETMHIAWCYLGEVPYCFSMSSVKFQGHMTKTIVDFDPNWAFPDCTSFSLNSPMAWSSIGEVPYCFSRSSVKFQLRSHGTKNCRFWPQLNVSGLWLQFEITNGFEMMHKAWSSIEELPYCFSRSSIKFQGHAGQKISNFDPNWAFPHCNSSLTASMDSKWCTMLGVV